MKNLNKIIKKRILALVMAFTILSVCSCGDGDQHENDKTSIVELDNQSVTENQTDKIEIYVSNKLGSEEISFSCDVSIPDDYEQGYPVYNMSAIEIDESYLNGLAKKIFDGGEYTEFVPAECCTRDEAKQYISELDRVFEEAQNATEETLFKSCYFRDMYSDYENAISKNPVSFRKKGCIYEYTSKDSVEGQKSISYKRTFFLGNIDGQPYIFCYNDDSEYFAQRITVTRLVQLEESSVPGICDYEETDVVNECDYEEAKQKSKKLLEKLDLEMPAALTCEYTLKKNSKEKIGYYDGYKFMYKRSDKGVNSLPSILVDGAKILDKPEREENFSTENDPDNALQESLCVSIDSMGIIQLTIVEPYCDYTINTKYANVMDVDNVRKSLEKYISEILTLQEKYENKVYDTEKFERLKKMELRYVDVMYENDFHGHDYARVPVWVFSYKQDSAYGYSYNQGDDYPEDGEESDILICGVNYDYIPYIGVNALDGSIIWFERHRAFSDPYSEYLSVVY